MANNILEGARDFQAGKIKINVTNISSSSAGVGELNSTWVRAVLDTTVFTELGHNM
jgi:hypothetical protein